MNFTEDTILVEGTTQEIDLAGEANLDEMFALVARSVPGYDLIDTPDLLRYSIGIPSFMLNGVIRTKFSEDEADARVQETLGFFEARDLPMLWTVGPSARPTNLVDLLARYGAEKKGETPGMVADLAQVEGLAARDSMVMKVTDRRQLGPWADACAAGSPVPPEVMGVLLKTIEGADDAQVACFLAYQDGQPVSTSAIYFSSGVAGIYCVATVPEARRQGFGEAVTRAAMREARERGYRYAILQASQMAVSTYRRLGFSVAYRLDRYVYQPQSRRQN